jgi:hypothetical protein
MRALDILVFFICVGAGVTMLHASGWGAETGVSPNPGISEQTQTINESLSDVQAERQEGASSFLGGTVAAANSLVSALSAMLILPVALQNLGVPGWIATPLSLPLYVIVGVFVVQVIRGMKMER